MNNTVVLKDRAYVEKKQSKKTWMDRVKNNFQENRETIIAGLLSMNGDVNAYRMIGSGKINNGIYSWQIMLRGREETLRSF